MFTIVVYTISSLSPAPEIPLYVLEKWEGIK